MKLGAKIVSIGKVVKENNAPWWKKPTGEGNAALSRHVRIGQHMERAQAKRPLTFNLDPDKSKQEPPTQKPKEQEPPKDKSI